MSTSCIFGYFACICAFMAAIQESWLNAPGAVLTTAKRSLAPACSATTSMSAAPACVKVHKPLTRGGICYVAVIGDDLDPRGLRLLGHGHHRVGVTGRDDDGIRLL